MAQTRHDGAVLAKFFDRFEGNGIQIGAAGALRGYKDTRVPMAINIFAYWVIAFPLAYMAAVTVKLPPNYIWGGFVAGLTVAAVMLSWRYARISGDAIKELQHLRN